MVNAAQRLAVSKVLDGVKKYIFDIIWYFFLS